jgi:hypothetical protein
LGLPIISEIWEGILWIINFFVDKVPRPVKIIIFLLFLLFFGGLISFFLHITGIHCNSNLEVVKTPITDLNTNVRILFLTKEDIVTGATVSICDAHPDKCGEEKDCYFFARRQNDSGFYEVCNETSTDPNCKYLMKEGLCFNCTEREICFNPVGAFWFFNGFCTWHSVCIDDAYYTELGSGIGCRNADDCSVPRGYMWNSTDGLYYCIDDDICGVNATQSRPIVDEYLLRSGADLVYSDSTDTRSYTKAIRIKCDKNLNPDLTFFGIPLFDYRIWLVIIIIAVMFLFLNKVKKH